jgi:cellulose synthase/poly-beta-1,6-N-acetylglucosamine synthase-like glycosyltransferase
MYSLFAVSVLSELVLLLSGKIPRSLVICIAGLSILSGTFASGGLLIFRPSIATVAIVVVSLTRCINSLRFVEGRMHIQELLSRSRRTWAVLSTTLLLILAYDKYLNDTFAISVSLLLAVQLVSAVLITTSVILARSIYRYRTEKKVLSTLPTVSVCIPARNETADLPACIESVLASTYPKLEIIVLDDCSHDKTPEIIKKYAHDGVRFVNGKEPREDWLAKNAAYDRLADEARGEILLFIGVDVRMEPHTITELITQFDGDDMLSVLPRRSNEAEAAFFIQPIRYWWELGLWRFFYVAPPVLSTCWLIRADILKKLGTFESVKKAVEPEAVFARKIHAYRRYAFLVTNNTIGLVSKKAPRDQFITALRKRYSQVRRRPETALAVLSVELMALLLPWGFLVYGIMSAQATFIVIPLLTTLLMSIANAEIYKLALRRLWLLGFVSMPLLIIADMLLMIRSMYAYEFGSVIWKERNICLPLLTVEKSLPKL